MTQKKHTAEDLSPEQFQDILEFIKKMPRKDAVKFIKSFVDSRTDIRADIITGQPIENKELEYLHALYKRAFPMIKREPQHIIDTKLEGGVRMFAGDEMVELTLDQLRVTN